MGHPPTRFRQWLLRTHADAALYVRCGGINIIPSLMCSDGASANFQKLCAFARDNANRNDCGEADDQRSDSAEGDFQAGTGRSSEMHLGPYLLSWDRRKGDLLLCAVDSERLLNG